MTEFIAIIIILIVITYFIGKRKTKKTSKVQIKVVPKEQNTNRIDIVDEKILYKKKGIKTFVMKGMFYQNLNPKVHSGDFIGIGKCEDNSHDMYAVGIYNQQNELLGYTPKGNKRLNNSLTEWNNGKVPVWGGLSHDNYDDRWYGTVYIPVGLTTDQIEKVERVLSLISDNQTQIKKKEKSTEKYFEILKRHKEITKLLADLKNPKELYYSFPKNLIPSISNHLEKEKNWEKLLELEKYQDLISELSEKFKETTLKRIEKAKKKVA
jgi:hypothetical protein